MTAFRIFRRLRDLLDVDMTGVADGDAVVYDSGSDKFVAGSAGGGSQPEPFVTTLDAADIYDLANTPVEILAAPGVNLLAMPDYLLYHYVPGDVPFVGVLSLEWQWADDAFGTAENTESGGGSFVTGGEQVVHTDAQVDVNGTQGDPADIVNQPLNLIATQVPNIVGPIATASVASAGTGYAPGDTGDATGFNSIGAGATYIIDTVDGDGGITGFTITTPGDGYKAASFAFLTPGGGQPGVGINAQFSIDTITPGPPADGTLEVIIVYRLIPFALA